jgi:hypothetical protein
LLLPALPGIAATLLVTNTSIVFGNSSALIASNIHGRLAPEIRGEGLRFFPSGAIEADAGNSEALSSAIGVVVGILVFAMQPGFALLESGSSRAQSVLIVAAKNTFDACIVAIVWFFLGYGLAFGDSSFAGMLGTDQFSLANVKADTSLEQPGVFHRLHFFLQFQFAANAVTVVSGTCIYLAVQLAWARRHPDNSLLRPHSRPHPQNQHR